jgi:RimJ/RimL family protein N-acetyltransferase
VNLVFGHDGTVADWAGKQFGRPISSVHAAVGVIDCDGTLVGAALFHDFNGSNAALVYYGPNTLTASVVRGLMAFAFDGLALNRVTAITARSNRIVTRGLKKLGFRFEGACKNFYGIGKRNMAIIYGLHADDARALLKGRRHGHV